MAFNVPKGRSRDGWTPKIAAEPRNEADVQRQILDWLRWTRHDIFVCHVPNGGARDFMTGAMLKNQGVVAGVPDLLLVYEGQAGFFEVKGPHGKVSPVQKRIMEVLKGHKAKVAVVHSVEDAAEAFEMWGWQKKV